MEEQTKKDEEIVQLVQSGKLELFSILVERYEDKMRRYAKKFLSDREDINDIIQDIFVKAYVNIQGFDVKRKFSSWLYRIAHNELVNILKKKKPLLFFDLDTFFPYKVQKETNNNIDIQKMIDKCLRDLKPKYREPIILHYLQGLTYKEIADIIQIPISTVGVRIKRAKEIMRKNI